MAAALPLKTARLPAWTLAACAAGTAVFAWPALEAWLIYDRLAIGNGEWWRLVTGHLVHLSPSHLFMNLAALIVVGAIIERGRYRRVPELALTAALAIGLVLYLAQPSLRFYGGLSGLLTAAVAYVALNGLSDRGPWRWVCIAGVVLLTLKLACELALEGSLFLAASPGEFEPIPLSHVTGAIVAAMLYGLQRFPAVRRNVVCP